MSNTDHKSAAWLGRGAVACALALAVTGFGVAPATAQVRPDRLTLDEAIELARRNNPTFLSTENDRGVAAWGGRMGSANLIMLLTITHQRFRSLSPRDIWKLTTILIYENHLACVQWADDNSPTG